MPPAARVTDMHTCPKVEPGPVPHVGGPILPAGAPTVLIGFMPAARVGDMLVCVGPPDTIVRGSATVFTENRQQARIGDPTIHGGCIVLGCPTVLVGDSGGGGASGGGGGGGVGAGAGAGGSGSGKKSAKSGSGGGGGGANPDSKSDSDPDSPDPQPADDPVANSDSVTDQRVANQDPDLSKLDQGGEEGKGTGLQQWPANTPDTEQNPSAALDSKDDPSKGAGLEEVKPPAPDKGPGPYETPEEAAKAALDNSNQKSIDENREAGGLIYKDKDGKYYYTGPAKGDGDHCCPADAPAPDGTDVVGRYHTHGDYSEADPVTGKPEKRTFPQNDDFNSDHFSETDRQNADNSAKSTPGFKSYLGTPSGKYKQYDPATGQETELK